MENVYLALIVAIPAMMSPLLMAWLVNRQRRQEKMEDYARQDSVAEKLIAADKLKSANARLTNTKLDVIHDLVNSSMTAALQSELDARRVQLLLMMEIVELKKAAGLEPTEDVKTEVGKVKGMISKLEASLAERLKQTQEMERGRNDKLIKELNRDDGGPAPVIQSESPLPRMAG